MGFYRFQAAKYSECELDYLKSHIDDPMMQLAGYLGKSANSIKNKIKEIKTGIVPTKKRSSKGTKIGKRADLGGLFVRSGWEADYMRYLNHTSGKFTEIQYEPTTFTFTEFGIKHGTIAYTPDFKVIEGGQYKFIEIKGFLKAEDKTKLNRFKKFYPDEFKRLSVVCGAVGTATHKFFVKLGVKEIISFPDLKRTWKDLIPFWES